MLGEVRLAALDLAGGELVFTVGPTEVLPLEIEEVVVRDHFVSTLLRDMLADDRTAKISDHLAEPLGDLVGRRVQAEGDMVVDGDGRLLGLDRARVGSAGRRAPDAVGQDDAHD